MKEEAAAVEMNKTDDSSSKQQQEELALTQQRSPAEARFDRHRDIPSRFPSLLRSSLIDDVASSLETRAGTVPVMALPNDLFARSVAFLHRACVKHAMQVNLLEPFQLQEYFCQEHGSELEPRQDIYDDISDYDDMSVDEDEATETEEENDDANGSAPLLKKCRECEMERFDRERCPLCECFSHVMEMHECCVCDKKSCFDCPKSDLKASFCEPCMEAYCPDCKTVLCCESCYEEACEDCAKEINFAACVVCNACLCDRCNNFVVCNDCNITFCDDCKESTYCTVCDHTYCEECRGPWYCEGCDGDPVCLSCAYGEDMLVCDVCTDCFCLRCENFLFCNSCDKSACESCVDFVQVSKNVHICTDCVKVKMARRRRDSRDQEQTFTCFACDERFAYTSKVAVSCRSQKETFCLACMRECYDSIQASKYAHVAS